MDKVIKKRLLNVPVYRVLFSLRLNSEHIPKEKVLEGISSSFHGLFPGMINRE